MKDMYRMYSNPRQCCEQRTVPIPPHQSSANSTFHHDCTREISHTCKKENNCPSPIGMAYVPMQEWSEPYDACEGLREGSVFPELNLIFCGVRGK